MNAQCKLTSIKLLQDLYKKFKIQTIDKAISLQRLTNRSMYLYVHDSDFKQKIENTDTLLLSGSGF